MSYRIEHMADLPVVFVSFDEDFDFGRDIPLLDKEVRVLLDSLTSPVYYIIDTRNMKMTFNDIMEGVQLGTRGEKPTLLHPTIKQNIFITTSKAISMVARGLNTASFGSVDIKIYATVEEALAYVRSHAA